MSEDFKTIVAMRELDEEYDAIDEMLSDDGTMEAELDELNDSFFTGFDKEKMERFNRMKSICQTISDRDREHHFSVLKVSEPCNRDHSGSIVIQIKSPSYFNGKEYRVIVEALECADSFVVCSINGGVRVSLVVQGVFYKED